MNPPPTVDDLKRLTPAELQRRWTQHVGGKSPPKIKLVLLRDLAWHAQQGQLDVETQILLKAAVRQLPPESNTPGDVSARKGRPRQQRPRPKPHLEAGAKLIRTWRGKSYEVEVVEPDKRFSFRGQSYSSLTQIAREITGAHWSGPRFFGLNRVRGIQ